MWRDGRGAVCNNARMAVTLAQMQTHLENARALLYAGSYASARNDCLAALACLAALPNAGKEGANLQYRQDINQLLKQIDALEAKSALSSLTYGPLQRTTIKYKRTTT